MIHIICAISRKFSDFHNTFAWNFPLIKTFQHRLASLKAWSFWSGMRFDILVWRFAEVGLIAAFFRICFYLICLIVFCRWLQVVLMICRSSFKRITIEFYTILIIAFSSIIAFTMLEHFLLVLFVWRKFFLSVSKSRHAGGVQFANSATCFDISSRFPWRYGIL